MVAAPGYADDEVLRLAASIDQGSEHPLAAAIVRAANERGLSSSTSRKSFESSTGIGVRGTLAGKAVALGNTALMQEAGVSFDAMTPQAETLRAEGASVMYLAVARAARRTRRGLRSDQGDHGRGAGEPQGARHSHGDGHR